MTDRKTVGEALIDLLEAYGVDTVFGIPGVHTVELYRGLASSRIRHVTPRHELSAGFMADGYARMSGKPGVCLLITGPGLTNVITAMGQARADSIPMLVISGVNKASTHGHEDGQLHELPDQVGLMRSIALFSHCLQSGADLSRVLARAFTAMTSGRPGPVHLEIPLDVMSEVIDMPDLRPLAADIRIPAPHDLATAAELCRAASNPVLLIGGGATHAEPEVLALAEQLDSPVVTTVNARGMVADHPLHVLASPSLPAVRTLLADADLVIAVGTQCGPTDCDMYIDGGFPVLRHLLRIDVDPQQLTRGVMPDTSFIADAKLALGGLLALLKGHKNTADGKARAATARKTAFDELIPAYQDGAKLIEAIGAAVPGCIMVGDSTQLVYAGNSYAKIYRNKGWFNSSVGYGSLGYGAPAAIGAQLAEPNAPVICITGDGGFQFCLSELGTAMDENTPVIFLVWNNNGFQEIENYMIDNKITTIGVTPSAPDFVAVAAAYGMSGERVTDKNELPAVMAKAHALGTAYLVELITD